MLWGVMMGGWMGGLVRGAPDPYRRELEIAAAHGLQVCQWSARALMQMPPARREEIAGWLEDLDMRTALHFGFDYFSADPDEIRGGIDATIEAIEILARPMRTTIMTTAAGRVHRFMRSPDLTEQLDRLERALTPIAAAGHAAGLAVGIENHGDYYCSDLVELCARVPHLGIFLDTGNPYLIGERPLPAAEAAAPFTIGTHFKDHYVRPNKQARPLCFEIRGAVVGAGDVGMREIYRVLLEHAPDPDGLTMVLEIDAVEGMNQEQALRESLRFVRSL